MTIGEKIKQARLSLGITQSNLGGKVVTKNMISLIESDKATPSFDTLMHICKELKLPIGYLLGDTTSLFFYKKAESIAMIHSLYSEKSFDRCIALISSLQETDNELEYISANCYFEIGIFYYKRGSFNQAKDNLTKALEHSKKTIFDTERIELTAPLYLAVCTNFNAPLLEFDSSMFEKRLDNYLEADLYHYLTLDSEYKFRHIPYLNHMEAKRLIHERKYKDALDILLEIEATRGNYDYDAFFMFSVYSDIDNCYKNLYDFENAYRYSSKRISLIEGFNS